MSKKGLAETPKRICGVRANCTEDILSKELGKDYVKYRKKWIKASAREFVTKFPLYIQIEHTGKCNLQCPICVQGIETMRREYSKGFNPLDIGLYKKILDEAKEYKCPSISFHNNDEPLILKDLENKIRMAKRAGFLDIILTTNATLLTRARTHKLLNSGLTKINFSIDAFRDVDYRERRIGGEFSAVLENIEYFLYEKKKANLKLPITRVTCVLTKYSIKDVDEFYRFWAGRVNTVELQNFQAIKGYTEKFRPDKSRIDKKFTCNAPWQQVVVRANGDVLPCCSFYGTEMVLGRIQESSIHDIWNSNEMKKIRNELIKNNFSFSSACKKCSGTFYALKNKTRI